MSNKTITMTVNSEDIRKLIGNSLSHIISRHAEEYQKELQHLNESVKKGNRRDILESLKNISKLYKITVDELDNTAPLILELEDSLLTDTEVVEDLPNEGNAMGKIGPKGSRVMPDGTLEDIE